MIIRIGETVIVTQDGVNRVGVVLDKFIASKRTVYDVLLENRSAVCQIGSTKTDTYVNTILTEMLCKTEQIETTIPYKMLLDNELLPITKS